MSATRSVWINREYELDRRLHEIYEETYQTEDREKLAELKRERLAVELELGEVRLGLYLDGRRLDV